eukprot:Skav206065  [mRNA]  locus=scaffold288:239560:248113:+ [translate_table: standard]
MIAHSSTDCCICPAFGSSPFWPVIRGLQGTSALRDQRMMICFGCNWNGQVAVTPAFQNQGMGTCDALIRAAWQSQVAAIRCLINATQILPDKDEDCGRLRSSMRRIVTDLIIKACWAMEPLGCLVWSQAFGPRAGRFSES